jgi:hypothetical protein
MKEQYLISLMAFNAKTKTATERLIAQISGPTAALMRLLI